MMSSSLVFSLTQDAQLAAPGSVCCMLFKPANQTVINSVYVQSLDIVTLEY